MTTQKISIGFTHLNDAKLELKARDIVAAMTGNASFPTPDPKINEVGTALDKFATDRVAAAAGSRNAVAARNTSRKVLMQLLTQLGVYVMSIAKGDVDMLVSSGFSLTKKPEPRHIANPGNVTISNGLSGGQLVASVKAVKGSSGYQYEISDVVPVENTVWVSTIASTSKYTFKNLRPGKQYWIRVAATGARQQLQYSEVVSKFAQ